MSEATPRPRSVIFGHAMDGNLHFMLNEQFSAGDQTTIVRGQFGDELFEIIPVEIEAEAAIK